MFSAGTVIAAICLYVAVLFVIAQWSERSPRGRRWAAHPVVYALGLGVYCTTWTYYGSVGKAASGGMGYLPVYLGPTLVLLGGSSLMRRFVRLKQIHRITSIADFASARYAKSQAVAALVTVILMVGIVPYVALQMKAVTSTFSMLTAGEQQASSLIHWFGPIVVFLMIVFTIVFGIRHLDPTERHPSMVVSLAAESIVKLTAFLAAGAFVFGLAFGGYSGFARSLDAVQGKLVLMGRSSPGDVLTYVTTTVISAAAFALLPRQFHVGIVEASDERHVKTAQWLTPVFLFLINLLVVPIAIGGKLVAAPGTSSDFYVLAVPLQAGHRALSMAVFVGGFSAAIGMIMIESMTMATMISNHLLMPVIQAVPNLRSLRRSMLYLRWLAAALFIIAGYVFERAIGDSYMLVAIGLISFAAAFVLAPIVLGGFWWKQASRAGALLGLAAGFVTWFYTLLLPTFVKSKWVHPSVLTDGPFGIALLKPEALLGWSGLPSLAHGVIWSTAITATFYAVGSLLFPPGAEERRIAEAFLSDRDHPSDHLDDENATIDAEEQRTKTRELLGQFYPPHDVEARVERCFAAIHAETRPKLTVVQVADLHTEVERTLAGAIGAASAHGAMKSWGVIDRKDSKALTRAYAKMLAQLKLSPKELKQRINYQQERETLLTEQYRALEAKVIERDREIAERKKAEAALQRAHDELELRVLERTRELRAILDNVVFGFLVVDETLTVGDGFTRSCTQLLDTKHIAGRNLCDLLHVRTERERQDFALAVDQVFADFLPEELTLAQMPQRFPMPDGRILRMEGRAVRDEEKVSAILMTISDITALEEFQRENEHNRALLSILRQRTAFEAFIADTRQQLESAREAAEVGDRAQVLRVVHTIKGNAASYGISHIARFIHDIEAHAEVSSKHIEEIARQFREYLEQHQSVLGLRFDAEPKASFDLNGEQVRRLESIARMLGAEHRSSVEGWLDDVVRVPARELIGPLSSLVESLAARLEKDVEFSIVGGDLRVDPNVLQPILHNLPHLLRNSLDHGIEDRGERVGKAQTAQLRVVLEEVAEDYVISVQDDGRGIDVARLVERAVAKGLLAPDRVTTMRDEEKLGLVFLENVSTAETVTDISGRGVGMSAIKAEVDRMGGTIRVHSKPGAGTRIDIRVPRRDRHAANDGYAQMTA